MMNPHLTLKKVSSLISGIGAVVALIAFALAEYQDRIGASLAAAGFCLALLFLATQDIEVFEGLGIKAKLRSTLSEAEQRIQKMDAVLYTLASATFFQIARGSLTASERKTLTDELTNSLLLSGVAPDKISALKAPIYTYIALHFWYAFGLLRANYLSVHANAAQKDMLSKPLGPERDAAEQRHKYFMQTKGSEPPDIHNFVRFRSLIAGLANVTPLAEEDDKQKLMKIADDLADAFDRCLAEGGFTVNSIRIIDQSGKMDTPYMQGLKKRLE